MNNKNPIKFLDSYSRDDKDIFFGRKKETTDLYEKIGKSKIVLLYGLSGTGKTSLVQCGLENRYEAYQNLFIYVRRGTDIIKSFKQAVGAEASSLIHPHAEPAEAIETLYFDFLKPIIIVFDQFEELFISGGLDERQEFISAIADILKSNLKVKFIFCLREEYLAHMDEFEEKIPSIYDLRLRLEKMRRSTLEDVITKIAEKGGIELESDKVPGMIINNISDRKGHVELPYLQVYLDKLTRLMNKSGGRKVLTIDFLKQAGELDDVLGDFLEEQITIIASETANKAIINNLLKQLITHDGTKRQITSSEIKPYGNSTADQAKIILAKLEDSRIIKLEDGIYELSHDSLAKKIAEKRTTEEVQLIEVIKFLKNANNSFKKTQTLLDRKQLKYVRPYMHLLELDNDEKELLEKSRKKERNLTIITRIFFAIVLIGLLVSGFIMQNNKYESFMHDGRMQMDSANYFQAKLSFQRAADVLHFIDKTDAEDKIKICNSFIEKEPEYKKLIDQGNILFNMGIINYDSAFVKYEHAKKLIPKREEINRSIEDKEKDAIKKYNELAIVENEEGHLDIALSHLSKAYALNQDNVITIDLFQKIISASTIENLELKAKNIEITNPQINSGLRGLLEKLDGNEFNNQKYKILRALLNEKHLQ